MVFSGLIESHDLSANPLASRGHDAICIDHSAESMGQTKEDWASLGPDTTPTGDLAQQLGVPAAQLGCMCRLFIQAEAADLKRLEDAAAAGDTNAVVMLGLSSCLSAVCIPGQHRRCKREQDLQKAETRSRQAAALSLSLSPALALSFPAVPVSLFVHTTLGLPNHLSAWYLGRPHAGHTRPISW